LKNAKKWQDMVDLTGTNIIALTNDLSGKSTIVCRYIRPQNPPHNVHSVKQIARFVSRIPFLPNKTVFAVRCDLWSTSDQILDVGAADAIEHAILLCNYLLYSNYIAMVAFGQTLLDGNTAFVILKPREGTTTLNAPTELPKSTSQQSVKWTSSLYSKKENIKPTRLNPFQICHPVTGNIYNFSDKDCPVTSIFGLFDNENIYSNTQSEKKLEKLMGLMFNLKDQTNWKPFFNLHNPKVDLHSIQVFIY
jgi:hypothetical protein